MEHFYYKRYIDEEGNYRIEYWCKGKFNQVISEDKPAYQEWLIHNTPQEIPYEPPPPPVFPFEEMKDRAIRRINSKTREIIEAGMEIKGVQVALDQYRQDDFNALQTANLGGDLFFPYIMWEGDDDILIGSAEEMKQVCLSVLQFVYTKRREGQQIRKQVNAFTTKQELENWSDPRV